MPAIVSAASTPAAALNFVEVPMIRTPSRVEVTDLRTGALLLKESGRAPLANNARYLALSIVEVAEDARLRKAALHAHRLVAAVGALLAHRALLHDALAAHGHVLVAVFEVGVATRLVPVEHTSVVRAGRHAHATTDALVVIDLHATQVILVRCARRAHAQARRVLAVLASNRQVRSCDMGIRSLHTHFELAALVEYAIPRHSHGHVVLHLARHSARVAPRATI